MNMKYRQAAANLSKQLKSTRTPDPLSTICSEKVEVLRKTKMIVKSKRIGMVLGNMPVSSRQEEAHPETDGPVGTLKETNLDGRGTRGVKMETNSDMWFRYFPQDADNFGEAPNREGTAKEAEQIPISVGTRITQGTKHEVVPCSQPALTNLNVMSIGDYKSKLGIGQVKEEPIKEEPLKLEEVKMERQPGVLPFAGRPFEQAPPRPPPKHIYEYPPPCKVAGLYEWPQPRSQYRQWKMQMKESRKLT